MIVCIVTRPLLFKCRRVEIGTRMDVTPAEAAELVSTTRAKLLNPADGPAVAQAHRAATNAALREAGRLPGWAEAGR